MKTSDLGSSPVSAGAADYTLYRAILRGQHYIFNSGFLGRLAEAGGGGWRTSLRSRSSSSSSSCRTKTWRCLRSSSSSEWWTFQLFRRDRYPQCLLPRSKCSSWRSLTCPLLCNDKCRSEIGCRKLWRLRSCSTSTISSPSLLKTSYWRFRRREEGFSVVDAIFRAPPGCPRVERQGVV